MPGPRQPINLVQAKGKKNLTKAEIATRKATEVAAPDDKVRPPPFLTKEGKREFNKIAKQLKDIGIITNLDVSALARFVAAQEMYEELTRKMFDDLDLIVDKATLNAQDKLFRQCRSASMDLGLTISSRCKLVMPTPKETTVVNRFERFEK